MNFQKKTVIVTGGGQGIGSVIARFYAEAMANVVIADIDEEAGKENEKYILNKNQTAMFVKTDVADEKSIKELIEKTCRRFNAINILINNAGVGFGKGDIFARSTADWDRIIDINLRGPYLCSKYAAKIMAENNGGSIINIASTRAFMSEADTEPYSASKGGLIALTHSLAVSLSRYKIRVNSISPGWIDVTPYKKSPVLKPEQLREKDHLQHPAGRVGRPEDVAQACLFLSSDESGFITGANLMVDGGMTVKMIYEE